MRDQWSVNVTYSNQAQGFLSLTTPSSRAIKPVVLFPLSSPSDPLTPPGVSIRHRDLQQRSGRGVGVGGVMLGLLREAADM